MPIVSDAGPILSFARSGLLGLLRGVAGELIIPTAVRNELWTRGRGKIGAVAIAEQEWIKEQRVLNRSVVEILPRGKSRGGLQWTHRLKTDRHIAFRIPTRGYPPRESRAPNSRTRLGIVLAQCCCSGVTVSCHPSINQPLTLRRKLNLI